MGWDNISQEWERYKPRVRERWARLAPSEIDMVAGDRDTLLGRIQQAYNIDRAEAEEQLREFEGKADPAAGWTGPAGPGRRTDD